MDVDVSACPSEKYEFEKVDGCATYSEWVKLGLPFRFVKLNSYYGYSVGAIF